MENNPITLLHVDLRTISNKSGEVFYMDGDAEYSDGSKARVRCQCRIEKTTIIPTP